MDPFYALTHFEMAALFQAHDKGLYETETEPLFAAYYATWDAIKGDDPEKWDEIHDILDTSGSTRSLPRKDRWKHFANIG